MHPRQHESILTDVLGRSNRPSKSISRGVVPVRSFLWEIMRCYVARCSMASWGLPFEAIAAAMLLREEPTGKRKKPSRED